METHSPEYILRVIADSLGRPLAEVQPEDKLVEIVDSLEMAQLILDLELEFSIDCPDDDLRKLFTVQDVLDYIHTRCAASRPQ